MSLKNKYQRPKPDQGPPRKKGNLDVINKIVNNELAVTLETVNPERQVKKATFELDASLHKKLRTFAALNDTTMVDIVEKAINEYLDRMDNK